MKIIQKSREERYEMESVSNEEKGFGKGLGSSFQLVC